MTPQEQIERDVWDLTRALGVIYITALGSPPGLMRGELGNIKAAYELLGRVVEKLEQKEAA